jgi:hypothetical protein
MEAGDTGFDMARIELVEQELTGSVIGAFYDVYNILGFGFLEHLYIMALERELLGAIMRLPVRYG